MVSAKPNALGVVNLRPSIGDLSAEVSDGRPLAFECPNTIDRLRGGALGEIKAEIRHTETSAFRKKLHDKEDQIRE